MSDVVRQYAGNPIPTKARIPYPVETVHNAAVVKHEGEYIMMLFRSHLRTGRSILQLGRITVEECGTQDCVSHVIHTGGPQPAEYSSRSAPGRWWRGG
jgi:hypothetical protein